MFSPAFVLSLLAVAVCGGLVGAVLTWAVLRAGSTSKPMSVAVADTAPPAPPAAPPFLPVARPALAADVLVVDDSSTARLKLRRLLESQGYSVQLAVDGVEALALLERSRYALMISDLEMPNMDGVTLIHTCLARPELVRMPILAISGHENLRARFNDCHDICGVHRKPWVDDVLVSHVATLVGPRRPPAPRTSTTAETALTA